MRSQPVTPAGSAHSSTRHLRWVQETGVRSAPGKFVALGAILIWLLLTGPLTWTEDHIAARMVSAHSVAADVYVLLAPGYLYVLIGMFALQLYALRVVNGTSTSTAVRDVVSRLPRLWQEPPQESAA